MARLIVPAQLAQIATLWHAFYEFINRVLRFICLSLYYVVLPYTLPCLVASTFNFVYMSAGCLAQAPDYTLYPCYYVYKETLNKRERTKLMNIYLLSEIVKYLVGNLN